MPAMITGGRNRVEVPAPPLARGGIAAVARVIDATDPHDLLGAEYETEACAAAQVWEQWCIAVPDCDTVSATVKDFIDAARLLVVGDPFALYTGVECDLARLSDAQSRATEAFRYGERAGIDLAITARIETGVAEIYLDVEDLGGPLPLAQAVGVLEGYAARAYGGVPTLIIPTELIPCGCTGSLFSYGLDGTIVTCCGSPVASAVTTNALDPPPASVTAYATGQITLIRGPLNTYTAPPGYDCDDNPTPPRALAERLYVPLIECFAAKVEVTCS